MALFFLRSDKKIIIIITIILAKKTCKNSRNEKRRALRYKKVWRFH